VSREGRKGGVRGGLAGKNFRHPPGRGTKVQAVPDGEEFVAMGKRSSLRGKKERPRRNILKGRGSTLRRTDAKIPAILLW